MACLWHVMCSFTSNVCSVCTYCGNAISLMACLWHVICSFTSNACSVCTYCGNAISLMACLWHVMCSFTSNVSKSIVKISLRTVPTNTVIFCSCRDVGMESTLVDFNCVINKEHARLYHALLHKLYHPATGGFQSSATATLVARL